MCRVTCLLVITAGLASAAAIGIEFQVKRSTDEWSGQASSLASAAVWDLNSVDAYLAIAAMKSDLSAAPYGGWMLRANLTADGGPMARVRVKVTYSDSTTYVLLDEEGKDLKAVFVEQADGMWSYLTVYAMTKDVLKDAVKLVAFFDNFSNRQFATPYWVFGATELRELRKVAVHEF